MKILVTGVNGQLGHDVVEELDRRGIPCRGVDIADFDLTDGGQVRSFIEGYAPDAVIHCAAYTAVDRAEDNREACYAVNVDGTSHVAKACAEIGAQLMYISTDYVFDGRGDQPFAVDAPTGPQSVYGETKLLGEERVKAALSRYFIVRISWVFGVNGGNFVRTMLRLGREKEELSVVCDQVGSPTYTFDLAKLLCDMIVTEKYGVYHATNEGVCSWYEFACEIMKQAGLACTVKPILSKDYPAKAARPLNSRLDKRSLDQAGVARLRDWHDALRDYLSRIL